MKETKNDFNAEKLWNAIDKTNDKYIEETILFQRKNQKRRRRIVVKGFVTAAAALVVLMVSSIFYHSNHNGNVSDTDRQDDKNQKGISAVISKSGLTVSVMAAENENIILEEGAEVRISSINYSPLLSSVPALPLTFDCENESDTEVTIRVATREDGMLMRYEVDSEDIWNCVESGQTMECKAGETLYWRKTDDRTYDDKDCYGKISVSVYRGETCVEDKSINIFSDDDMTLRAVLTSKHGITYKDNIIYAMDSVSDVNVYMSDIYYCSGDYIMFANLGGLIIYDRTNQKIASVIDLQELDCNSFDTDTRITRIMPTDEGILIFNEKNGKVEENAYRCTWENGMERPDIQLEKLSDTQDREKVLEKWKIYSDGHIKGTWENFSHILLGYDANTRKYSCDSIGWQDGNGSVFDSFLLKLQDDGEDQYYIVSVDGNGERKFEKLEIAFAVRQETLPKFAYTGNDEILKALCAYGLEEYGTVISDGAVKMVFPCIYTTVEQGNETIVFLNLWEQEYIRVGNVLQDTAGGENPMRVTLERTEDGYRVTNALKAGDGDKYLEDIEDFTEGYDGIRDMYLDYEKNRELRNQVMKDLIKMYVKDNHLDIKYFKEYGWDKVEIQ